MSLRPLKGPFFLVSSLLALWLQVAALAEQVVIREIMYHPTDGHPEYVEIANITSTPFDIALWRLSGGVDYTFPEFSESDPESSFLPAFGSLLIASVDEATFRKSHTISPSVRVLGPWIGALNNAGDRVTLKDKNDVTMSTVQFNDRGKWPVAADGTGHSLVIKDVDDGADNWRNWTISRKSGGSPGTPEITLAEEPIANPEIDLSKGLPVIDFGDSWKFNDRNEDLGTGWREPDYDDSDWASGSGLFGFEDAALPAPGIQTPLQDSPTNANHLTYYFRHEFAFNGQAEGATLTIDQIVDDGVLYYLNGELIGGVGVPVNPNWRTAANRNVGNAQEEFGVVTLENPPLRTGRNVLAAELHQTSANSSDAVFGARLSIAVPRTPSVVLHEIYPLAAGDGFIEFYNPTDAPIDLQGYALSDDRNEPLKSPITESVVVPVSGLWSIDFAAFGFTTSDPLAIYLANPEGTLVSAISARVPFDGRSIGQKPSGSTSWYLFTSPTPGEVNASVLQEPSPIRLNEVHFDADGVADWIEIINPSTTEVPDLAGLRLASTRDFLDGVPLEGSLEPGELRQLATAFPLDDRGELILFLTDTQGAVIQAEVFEPRAELPSFQAYPDGGTEWYASDSPSAGQANLPNIHDSIVISEIMCDPPSNSRNGEYLELYNRGAETVDLNGWEFVDGIRYTFPPGSTLDAGGYLVIAGNADYLDYAQGVRGSFDGSLSNTGELIRLVDRSGNLVDEVDYKTGGNWPTLANGGGSSLELVHPGMNNDYATAWQDSDESTKSEFIEFSYNGDYEELRRGGTPANFEEIHMHLVGDSHIIMKSIAILYQGKGENLLINPNKRSTNGEGNTGWLCQGTHWASYFEGENFHLISDGHGDNRPNRVELDVPVLGKGNNYTYKFQARWVSGKPRLIVQTWEHSFGDTFLLPIPKNLGTPGTANSIASEHPAPQVVSVRHSPAVPRSSEPVRILTEVANLPLLARVEVAHRQDSSSGDGPWRRTAMNDDGADGDETAGDGVFTTTLTDYQNDGQIAQFFVQATGANEARTQMPKLGEERPGMWIVDDSQIPGDLHTLRFVISAFDRNAMATSSGESASYDYNFPRLSNHYFNMTFIANESKIVYGGEIRKSGSAFLRTNDSDLSKAKWKLPGDQPFRGRIKNGIDDDAVQEGRRYHNRLARYWLYLLGNPVNEGEFVRVVVNEEEPQLRENVEPVSNDFLDRNFADGTSGELYRIDDEWWFGDTWSRDGRDADWSFKGTDNPLRYHTEWMKRTRETEYDYSSLTTFFRTVTDDKFSESEINRMADPDLLTMYAAVRGYIDDWDSITLQRGKNAFFYRKPTDGRFMLLQWDSDLAFRDPNAQLIGNLPGIRNYFLKPYIKRRFNHYLSELVNQYAGDSARLQTWFDMEEAASASYTVNRNDYQQWFANRQGAVTRELGSTGDQAFAITSGGGNTIETSQATLDLSGTSPSSVVDVTVAGHPEAIATWSGLVDWTLSGIGLGAGEQTLTIEGRNHLGTLVTSAEIQVIKAENAPPRVILDADPRSLNLAVGQRLELDGSASVDPEGGPLTWTWETTPSAPAVALTHPSPEKLTAVFSQPGLYAISAQAEDDQGSQTSTHRDVAVYAQDDFVNFADNRLPEKLTPTRVALAGDPAFSSSYSLEERADNLVIQVANHLAMPLTLKNPLFPSVLRPLPVGPSWVLQTDVSLLSLPTGDYQVGLIVETLLADKAKAYAFGNRRGETLGIYRGAGTDTLKRTDSVDFSADSVSLRIRRESQMLHFEYRASPEDAWAEVGALELEDGEMPLNGGVSVSTESALTVRAAFDYLMVIDPDNASNLQRYLRVSEIMYHPPQGDGYEFIELTNTGPEPLSLAGVTLAGGNPVSELTIGEVTLAPGGFTVLVANAATMRLAYGSTLPIAGEWVGGKLSNDGERLRLLDPDHRIIQEFTYNDGAGWPPEADGLGRSLQITDTQNDYDRAASWQASAMIGGTPGGLSLIIGGGDRDSDGDGLTDDQETALGTNAFLADSDGDGWTDGQEVSLGTNPVDPTSLFAILSIDLDSSNETMVVSWPSVSGKNYVVESSQDLTANSWQSLKTVNGEAGANVTSSSLSLATVGDARYFRIRLAP